MMTDPRDACANERQRLLWALIHDGLAHPLMALTGYCKVAVAFHDWTSHKAWPREDQATPSTYGQVIYRGVNRTHVMELESKLRVAKTPFCIKTEPGFYADGGAYYVYQVEKLA